MSNLYGQAYKANTEPVSELKEVSVLESIGNLIVGTFLGLGFAFCVAYAVDYFLS